MAGFSRSVSDDAKKIFDDVAFQRQQTFEQLSLVGHLVRVLEDEHDYAGNGQVGVVGNFRLVGGADAIVGYGSSARKIKC